MLKSLCLCKFNRSIFNCKIINIHHLVQALAGYTIYFAKTTRFTINHFSTSRTSIDIACVINLLFRGNMAWLILIGMYMYTVYNLRGFSDYFKIKTLILLSYKAAMKCYVIHVDINIQYIEILLLLLTFNIIYRSSHCFR